MICAISGEAPQAPVVSRKNGNIYERRLIEQYIREHGTDPVTGEETSTEDLLDLKQPRAVKPRAPTQTSVPALLSTFQNEWDALILETYELKQALATTRQELSTALYYNDSAEKVIARLTKERDEARDALSKVTVGASGNHTNGTGPDAMQVDGQGLPESVTERFDRIREELSKTRRKRAVPETWATADLVSTFDWADTTGPVTRGSRFVAMNAEKELVLVGGENGTVVYSRPQGKTIHTLDCGSATSVAGTWAGPRAIVGLSNGTVKVFEGDGEVASFTSHAGAVTSICLHPCGDVVASTGIDKSFVLYDLQVMKPVKQQYINSVINVAAFHPDGHLLGLGTAAGKVEMFDAKTLERLADYDAPSASPISALAFSENGTWLAVTSSGQNAVSIWDLRKGAVVHTIEAGADVSRLAWDYTGQFLAILATGCAAVHHYSKAAKAWSQPWVRAGSSLTDLAWGADARSLVVVDNAGKIAAALPKV